MPTTKSDLNQLLGFLLSDGHRRRYRSSRQAMLVLCFGRNHKLHAAIPFAVVGGADRAPSGRRVRRSFFWTTSEV
jgi:hypothetical protein